MHILVTRAISSTSKYSPSLPSSSEQLSSPSSSIESIAEHIFFPSEVNISPAVSGFPFLEISLLIIIYSCTLFTNAIEHLGCKLKLGNNATGSILAVIGTGLPETIVPLVAIIGAVILGNEDYLSPAKAIYEYTKKNEAYKIKGGIVEGKVMTAEEIITLAKLPSRETLLSMLAGALLGNISKLAVALDQVKAQKENA